MQIIYSKTKGPYHRNEKEFSVAPGECILLVLEQEEKINQMKKRSNFSTRACYNNTVIVLFSSDYNYWTMNVPKNISMENFLITYDIAYAIKSMPLMDLVNSNFLNHEQLIYAYFKYGS